MPSVDIGWTPEREIERLKDQNTEAWCHASAEAERRTKAERRLGAWQSMALSAWIVIAVRLLGQWLEWWPC
jgi:hypothetical protein